MVGTRAPLRSWDVMAAGMFVVLGALFHAEAARHVSKSAKIDVDSVIVDNEGGIVLPDGSTLPPFHGMKVEGHLYEDAFKCQHGRVMGIRLPGREKQKSVFYYLRANSVPQFKPIEIYIDIADETSQFLLFPPVPRVSTEWRMLYSKARTPGNYADWAEQRFFRVGRGKHPCEEAEGGDEDTAEEAEVEATAAPTAEAAAGTTDGGAAAAPLPPSTDEDEAPEGAGDVAADDAPSAAATTAKDDDGLKHPALSSITDDDDQEEDDEEVVPPLVSEAHTGGGESAVAVAKDRHGGSMETDARGLGLHVGAMGAEEAAADTATEGVDAHMGGEHPQPGIMSRLMKGLRGLVLSVKPPIGPA